MRMLNEMDSRGQPGCTRHLGEFIQSHCATCNQILCVKCLTTGHSGHDVKRYELFLRDRRKEAEAQIQRLKSIRRQVENQKAIFTKLRADLKSSCKKTELELKSFEVVQDGMKDWKKNLTDDLQRKKLQQLQNLDMAVCNPDSKSFIVKVPKLSINKCAELIPDIQKIVRELTPGSIFFLTSSKSRHSLITFDADYDDIIPQRIESYIEKNVSQQNNKQQKKTGYINVDEMREKNELPPPLPPRLRRGQSFHYSSRPKQPRPLPRLKSSSSIFPPGQPTYDNEITPCNTIVAQKIQKQTLEEHKVYNIKDKLDLEKSLPTQCTPSPIHKGFVIEGNPSYGLPSLLKQEPIMTEEFQDNDTLYEKIEDINKTTVVPVINPQNEPNGVYEDTTIASSRSPNIITNGCLAETPGESIDLYDVCVNPQGWLIFSDPTNCCLRILMDTTKSSERMTKRLKDDIQPWAVTYDSSNQRIIFATKSGLSQLQFGDTKLKKLKEKKLLKGISPQFISCTTTSNKEERMHVYATILPRGRERSIQCYDENGDFCRELEVAKMPCGIDYCQEYLVVATLQDGCLAKITPYGQSLWSNEVDAQKPGILQHPFGVVILPNEYIAVTESDAHRISIFSSEGKLVLRFGKRGSEPGKFNTPRGVAVQHSKELVVIDSGNNRIQIFSLDSIL